MKNYLKIFGLFFIVHHTYSAVLNLTCEDIRAFVDGHNNRRYKLAKGQIEGQPPASDMLAMVWDQELAEQAAEWASTYSLVQNADRFVDSARFIVGENTASAKVPNKNDIINIDDVLAMWFSENSNYTFAPISNENVGPDLPIIGHYTQMAWANSMYLGCAISYELDEEYKTYYVICAYGPSGNYDGKTPYTAGHEGESYPYICKASPECKHPYGEKCIFN